MAEAGPLAQLPQRAVRAGGVRRHAQVRTSACPGDMGGLLGSYFRVSWSFFLSFEGVFDLFYLLGVFLGPLGFLKIFWVSFGFFCRSCGVFGGILGVLKGRLHSVLGKLEWVSESSCSPSVDGLV